MVSEIKKGKLIGAVIAVIAVIALLIYLGIFWWTMLGILAVIIILMHFSLSINVKASRAEGVKITAKYLFLTLYPRKKSSQPAKPNAPPAYEYNDDDFSELDDIEDADEDEPESCDEPPETEPPTPALTESSDKAEAVSEKKAKAEKQKPDKKESKKEDKLAGPKPKGKLAALKEKFELVKPYIPIGWKAVKKFCKAIRFEGVDIWAEVGRFDAHEAAIYYGAVQGALFDLLGKIALFFTLKLKRADVRCCFGENKLDGAAELTVRVRPSTLIAIAFCTGIKFIITFFKERKKRKQAAKANATA